MKFKKMKLKPCPFCGGEATIVHEFAAGELMVECKECLASTNLYVEDYDGSKAAAAWNRRAKSPNPPLTLDELREMDGEPVWLVEGKAKYYALITDIFPKAIWVTSRTDSDAEMPVDEYGKTWLAYRRKPEEAQNAQ